MITPEESNVLLEAIDSALIDVHTALPGAVQTYTAATQTADIEIHTKRILEKEDGTLISEELPLLVNVPVMFFRNSNYYLSLPLQAGDTGLVVFSETSLDQWRTKGSVTSPSDIERHGLSGGVFLPGLFSVSGIIVDADMSTHAVFGATDTSPIKIKNSFGEIEIKATGQVDVNGNLTVDP